MLFEGSVFAARRHKKIKYYGKIMVKIYAARLTRLTTP